MPTFASTLKKAAHRESNRQLQDNQINVFAGDRSLSHVVAMTLQHDELKRAKVQKQSSIFDHFLKVKVNSENKTEHLNHKMTSYSCSRGPQVIEVASSSVSSTVSCNSSQLNCNNFPLHDCKLDELTEQEKELLELELTHLPPSWLPYVWMELRKPYLKSLKQFLQSEYDRGVKIFPPSQSIYMWAHLCPFDRIKVVILGQDPYHNDGQAMGLCFSVPPTTAPLPPSLVNIYKELATDIDTFGSPPKHGDLSGWAKQGVLLLNTSLTVRAHEPASHAGRGWELFTDSIIKAVNLHRNHCVFILWGNHAQKKSPVIDKGRHLVLPGVHPSPLSASRGFLGCKHFSKTNQYLQSHGMDPIDWSSL